MSQAILHQVKQLADQLSFDEKLTLVEYLAQQLRQAETPSATAHSRKPRNLRGIWKGKFPEDIDLESLLHDIRHEWEKEWPQVIEQ
jgi:sugar diacid utilization regulator